MRPRDVKRIDSELVDALCVRLGVSQGVSNSIISVLTEILILNFRSNNSELSIPGLGAFKKNSDLEILLSLQPRVKKGILKTVSPSSESLRLSKLSRKLTNSKKKSSLSFNSGKSLIGNLQEGKLLESSQGYILYNKFLTYLRWEYPRAGSWEFNGITYTSDEISEALNIYRASELTNYHALWLIWTSQKTKAQLAKHFGISEDSLTTRWTAAVEGILLFLLLKEHVPLDILEITQNF